MFKEGPWTQGVNVTDFVYKNLTPYEGDASFLVGPTNRTKKIWNLCLEALEEERANGGVRSFDAEVVSTISSHTAGSHAHRLVLPPAKKNMSLLLTGAMLIKAHGTKPDGSTAWKQPTAAFWSPAKPLYAAIGTVPSDMPTMSMMVANLNAMPILPLIAPTVSSPWTPAPPCRAR